MSSIYKPKHKHTISVDRGQYDVSEAPLVYGERGVTRLVGVQRGRLARRFHGTEHAASCTGVAHQLETKQH